jgi:hypothetical protein
MDSYFKTSSIPQLKEDKKTTEFLLGRIVGPEHVLSTFNVPESEYPTDVPYSIIQLANWWHQIEHYIQLKS